MVERKTGFISNLINGAGAILPSNKSTLPAEVFFHNGNHVGEKVIGSNGNIKRTRGNHFGAGSAASS
jgi:hypothetical protein